MDKMPKKKNGQIKKYWKSKQFLTLMAWQHLGVLLTLEGGVANNKKANNKNKITNN